MSGQERSAVACDTCDDFVLLRCDCARCDRYEHWRPQRWCHVYGGSLGAKIYASRAEAEAAAKLVTLHDSVEIARVI